MKGILSRVAIVAIGVTLIVSGWWLWQAKLGPSSAAIACSGAKSTDFTCYQAYYQRVVADRGIPAAFKDLKAAYQTSPTVRSDCHQLTHVIGRAAALKFTTVSQAYEAGDNFCWSGYYHGIMETEVKQLGFNNLGAKANTICAGVREGKEQYSFYHYNCVHGLGHGFMAVEGDELFQSLSTCDFLSDSWERESCYGGVFMENIMADINKFHSTKYLKPSDPLYPCTAVAEKYKDACYLGQTSYALRQVNEDFSKVFALCTTVEEPHRATCYQSLGRDASGNSISNAQQTKSSCMLGPDFEAQSNCFIGAVKDFISYYHAKKPGDQLCDQLAPDLAAVCRSTASDYFKLLKV